MYLERLGCLPLFVIHLPRAVLLFQSDRADSCGGGASGLQRGSADLESGDVTVDIAAHDFDLARTKGHLHRDRSVAAQSLRSSGGHQLKESRVVILAQRRVVCSPHLARLSSAA